MHGFIVNQVIQKSQHMTEANDRLEKIGHRIGLKIVDEYMKEPTSKPCSKVSELVEKFSTVGVRRFLGPIETKHEEFKLTQKGFSFNLRVVNNPLLKNLEIPTQLKGANLHYQSIIKGVIRGAFEVLKFKVEVIMIYESLKENKNQSIFFVEAAKM